MNVSLFPYAYTKTEVCQGLSMNIILNYIYLTTYISMLCSVHLHFNAAKASKTKLAVRELC